MLFNSGNPNLIGYTRFLVNDPSTAVTTQFSLQEVKDAVNLAYFDILGEIKNTNKDIFIRTSFADTVVDQVFYQKPSGFLRAISLEVEYSGKNLDTDTTADPNELDAVDYDYLQEHQREATSGVYLWAPVHEHFAIYPAVDTAGTKSMELVWEFEPTALSSDTDAPTILPTEFHKLICIRAAKDLKTARDLDYGQLERDNLIITSKLITKMALRDYESFDQFKSSAFDYSYANKTKQGWFGKS